MRKVTENYITVRHSQ